MKPETAEQWKAIGKWLWDLIKAPWATFQGLIRADSAESPSRFVTVIAGCSLSYSLISLTHAVSKCSLNGQYANSPKAELGIVAGSLVTFISYIYTQAHMTERKAMTTGASTPADIPKPECKPAPKEPPCPSQ